MAMKLACAVYVICEVIIEAPFLPPPFYVEYITTRNNSLSQSDRNWKEKEKNIYSQISRGEGRG